MATFYKYADRTASDYVDWGKIASDLSSTLLEQKKIREEKKDAIEKYNRESYNTLADAPTGEDKTYSDKAISYSGQATNQMLMINRMLKSGQMDYKDFLAQRQNIMDDTNVAFGLFKDYQTEYADKMKRMNDDVSHGIEQFAFGSAEGYGNMNEYDFIIDPTTSRVYLGKMTKGKDGVPVLDKKPSNYAPVQSLKARVKTKVDKFDSDAALKKGVDMMGKEIQATKQYGRIDYFADITKRKATGEEGKVVGDYLKSEDLYISSLMSDMNAASVLTDYLKQSPDGKQYKYTWDKAEADADKSNTTIYVEQTTGGGLKPVLNQAQKDVAKEAMKSRFRIMLDREHKIDAVTEPTRAASTDLSNQGKKAEIQTMGQQVYNLRNGDPDQKQSAAQYFQGLSGGNIKSVDTKDPTGVSVVSMDNRKIFIPYGDNLQQFSDRLTLFTGNNDASTSVAMLGIGGINVAPTTHAINSSSNKIGKSYNNSYFVKTGSGKAALGKVTDIFDKEIGGGLFSGYTENGKADLYSEIIQKSLGSIAGENAPASVDVNVVEGSAGSHPYVTVNIPNVTNGSIALPVIKGEGGEKEMKKALAAIYDAVNTGATISATDMEDIFKGSAYGGHFKTTNNITTTTEQSGRKSAADY